jgi:vanillate/3-O-methylgallate O-demethylase
MIQDRIMRSNAPISLQDKIDQHGDLWSMLYDAAGKRFTFPIQAEFSNWVDEQQAWRESAIFQNMSHHMTEGHIEGPDVVRLLSDLGINSFANFGPMQAKQYVACNYDGQFIGDAILFCEEENKVSIVGKPMLTNWIKFHIETGDYDAQVTQVDRPSPNLSDRVRYRFQVQGPWRKRAREIVRAEWEQKYGIPLSNWQLDKATSEFRDVKKHLKTRLDKAPK